MKYNIKKLIAQLLILSMILCNNSFYTFADTIDDVIPTTTSVENYSSEESDNNLDTTTIEPSEGSEEQGEDPEDGEAEVNGEDQGLVNPGHEEPASPDPFDSADDVPNKKAEYEEEPEEDNQESDQTDSTDVSSSEEIDNTDNDGNEGNIENPEGTEATDATDSTDSTENTDASSEANNTDQSTEESGTEVVIESDTDIVPMNQNPEVEISTPSDLETLIEENRELYDMLCDHGIVIDNPFTLLFMKELEYEHDGDYLIAKMGDYYYLIDQQFIDKYATRQDEHVNLFGAGNVSVTLDFGTNRPGMANTSNEWNTYDWSTAGQQISFSGPEGAVIYTTLKTTYTNLPTKTYGSYTGTDAGKHVTLPTFGNIWTGFTFEGWLDSDGNNLNDTQQGTFFYAFPYGNSITYTASWIKNTNTDEILNIKYYRATYSSAMSNPYVESDTIENFTLVTEYNETKKHGDFIFMDAPEVVGYKVSSMVIANVPRTESSFADLGAEGLKTKDFNDNFIDYDETVELQNNTTLLGRIPNHNLYIEYYYEPDSTQKNLFSVYYYSSTSYEELKVSDSQLVVAESIISCNPADIPNYEFLRAEVEITDEDLDSGVYGLGHYHTADEKYTTEQVNAADGAFKAVMPNQEVKINYYYKIDSTLEEPFYLVTEVQQEDGTYDISTVSSMIHLGSDNTYTVNVENKQSQGFGIPVIANKNVFIQSYNSETGVLQYYIDNFEEHVLTITYAIDYTSDYWTKLGFNILADGHGTIAASEGTKPLIERYIKRNETYNLSDLIANIDITVDEYYICVWYKNKTSGIGPSGDPLPDTGITVTGSNYNLFASFEEDPSWWVDVQFTATDHCSITGTSNYHLLKNTQTNTITFPTVVVETGYRHYNNEWLDETGAVLGATFVASHSYIPHIQSKFAGSLDAVKPVAHVTYNSNGTGKANLFGVYNDRKYVLTNNNDEIIQISNAEDAKNGFDNLSQGKSYHLYEALNGVALPSVGEVIATSEPNISQKYDFGIRALNGNYAINEDGSTITVTAKANTSYALLDDRYNIITDWTTAPTFTGLTRGTYYLVVAKNTTDVIDADDQDVIRNGEVIFTKINDLSQRKYRLVVFGDAYAVGAGSVTTMAGAKVYQVTEGTQVTVRGQNNYKMKCITNNVQLNEDSISNVFAMPSQDVVINDFNSSNSNLNSLYVYNAGINISVLNFESIKNTLNSATVISQAVADDCPMTHNLVISRYATNKATVQALGASNGKVAPYEYKIDVQTVVMGGPYKNSNESTADYTSFLAFDKAMIGNDSFDISSGTFNCIYTNDDKQIGLAKFELSNTVAKSINYIKNHKVNVKSTTAGLTYDEDFYVADGQKLTTAINYGNLEAMMDNVFDDGAPNVAKEYIYDSLTLNNVAFDVDNTDINKKLDLIITYTLNQDREDIKTEFSTEIYNSNQKYSTLSYNPTRNTFLTAIQAGTNIRNNQKNYTVDELIAARDTLRTARENANDPPATVNLDGNGGNLSINSIVVILGDGHNYATLSNVVVQRENYNFVSWNTLDDGTGTAITSNTIVGQTAYDTLYAIWEEIPEDQGGGTEGGGSGSRSGSGGSGGGGGGGGMPQTQTQLLKEQIPLINPMNLGVNTTVENPNGVTEFFKTRSSLVYETDTVGAFFIKDPVSNIYNLRIGNINTNEVYKSQWVTVFTKDNQSRTYRADADGNVVVGKYVDENNYVYFLNDDNGIDFGTVQSGWIYDDKTNGWLYANPINGTIVTGWQSINGKDYYFYKTNDTVNNGLGALDKYNRDMYGIMLKNTITPDGFVLGEDGARIEEKPYLLNATK